MAFVWRCYDSVAQILSLGFLAGILLLGTSSCQQNGKTGLQPWPQSYESISGTIAVDGDRSAVSGARVGPTFFVEAKVSPLLGRSFIDSDSSNRQPVIILSEKEWHDVFHSDPSVIGRTVQVNGQSRTVVGIMPRSFDFPAGTVFWIPR